MEHKVRQGYIMIADGRSVKAVYSYEELFMNPLLRRHIRDTLGTFEEIRCCCRPHGSRLSIDENGDIIYGDPMAHSDRCRDFFSLLAVRRSYPVMNSFYAGNTELPVSFSWKTIAKADARMLRPKDLQLGDCDRLSLSSYICLMNALAFRGAKYSDKDTDYALGLRVLSRMGTKILRNDAIKDGPVTYTIDEKTIFGRQGIGEQGFYYGRIVDVPEKYIHRDPSDPAHNKPFMFVVLTSPDGKRLGIRVKKKEFLPFYDVLPAKESAWFCGFIKIRQVAVDSTFGKKGSGVPPPPLPNQQKTSYVAIKAIVREARMYRLFTCNDAGMIVFSKEEYDLSNAALRSGAVLYR